MNLFKRLLITTILGSFYLFLFSSLIYSQCDYSSELSCNLNEDCEWVEDISQGNCYYAFSSYSECIANGCSWYNPGTYGYMGSHCYGGTYTIDNSYCEEIEMPECSDMNQMECNADDGCSWYDDVDSVSCGSLSVSECSQYFNEGCSLDADCIQWGSWYTWICYEYGPSYCTGGDIDIDNSSCEEIQYQLGDINGDLSINILDVIATVSLIQDGVYNSVVDIDSNGVINILDVIQLINIIMDRN